MSESIIDRQLAALQPLRTIDVPDFRDLVEDDPIALTLVVDTTVAEGWEPPTEQQVLVAAAHAVASAMTSNDSEVQAAVARWCEGRIRKLVKRAKNNAFSRLSDSADYITSVIYDNAHVKVFKPQPISQMAPELRKLQVQGLQFERASEPESFDGPYLRIQLDDALGMSTGKAAAQVGHAAQLFLMRAPEAQVRTWFDTRMQVRIEYVDRVEAEYEIRDAGYTEVAPNSLTAGSSFIA